MALLPALVEADIESFGAALSEIQEMTGRWFASAQGGTFAPGAPATLVRRMAEWGARGVGQSSWGPAVYGIVDGEDAGASLAARVRDTLGPGGHVYEGPFRSDGWRARSDWRRASSISVPHCLTACAVAATEDMRHRLNRPTVMRASRSRSR